MQCPPNSTAGETQIKLGNEDPDDQLAGVAASSHGHDAEASAADQGATKSSTPHDLPPSHFDFEKGISVAEAELFDLDLGQGSVKNQEDEKCRVCHLVFESEPGASEAMRLGCNCKDDLSIAHRDCAEAWFKIRGNRICEICGATVQNIVGNEDTGFLEQWNDRDASTQAEPSSRCWQSLSLCNFFLACMVVTFILLWLFRVTIT